jgi:hypothetical protein
MTFDLPGWQSYRRGCSRHRAAFAKRLARINSNDRVIFYGDKA